MSDQLQGPSPTPTDQIQPVIDLPVIGDEHNVAYDSSVTRGPAIIFEKLAEPLNEHIYGPLTEKNRLLGMVVMNATLTAPRLLEPVFGQGYINNLRQGNRGRAFLCLLGKTFLKLTDGLDGPVARANGITSLFGAGFDPAVDMQGTRDDGKRIKEAHEHLGMQDEITEAVIDLRLGLDLAVAAVGGAANTAAAKYAESKGVVLPERDQPKANPPAKAKFFLSSLADAVLLAGTLFEDPKKRKRSKQVGVGILIASVAAGGLSLVGYAQSTRRNVEAARNASHESDHVSINTTD